MRPPWVNNASRPPSATALHTEALVIHNQTTELLNTMPKHERMERCARSRDHDRARYG